MTDAALRAYLLGKLTESEVALVETRLLEDADLFSQIESAEDDLFDAYARGRLDADEQARFRERFGADGARVRFAQALSKRTSTSRVVPFVRRPWVGLAVAASLILVVGTFMTRRERVAPASTAPAAPSVPAAVPQLPVTQQVSLALGTSRAAGAPTSVVIDSKAQQVDVRIRLNPADRFAVYAVQVRTAADTIAWSSPSLSAQTEDGDLVVHAVVPAEHLSAGAYEFSVRGGASASSMEDLGFLPIEVRRAQ